MTCSLPKVGGYNFWLGGSDTASEGNWVWQDGSAFTWTNWRSGQPSDYSSYDCLLWEGHYRNWRDYKCSYDRYSVCQVKVSKWEGREDGGILARTILYIDR